MSENQLKHIPSVSEVLQLLPPNPGLPRPLVIRLIQRQLEYYRGLAQRGELALDRRQLTQKIIDYIHSNRFPRLKNVINATGVVLHTGLGRAPLSPEILTGLGERLGGYVNLEFDLDTGERGERNDHVAPLLAALVGAEDALLVNNNAAAVFLTLNTLAENREVIVSRGQQVEIGGSFRIPDIIAKSGCVMQEVGTTNRTHLRDYAEAINQCTALLLWAHTSNYVVRGFTAEVTLEDLVALGRQHGLPVVADLGSGALIDLPSRGLPTEPQVAEILKKGVAVVTFSGDKLLGGPQAGLIAGDAASISRIHANPIYRVVRCDKVNIALLETILNTYDGTTVAPENLAWELLSTSRETLLERGRQVLAALAPETISELGIELVESQVEAGSGSLPVAKLPSAALRFKPVKIKTTVLARLFRNGEKPIVGYIHDEYFFIDLKAVLPEQLPRLAKAIAGI
ncbi:MAG: L-seryl-tRNA(Sec) selenium transferase [Candidatus Neomarinimicrobiota bacterium]